MKNHGRERVKERSIAMAEGGTTVKERGEKYRTENVGGSWEEGIKKERKELLEGEQGRKKKEDNGRRTREKWRELEREENREVERRE